MANSQVRVPPHSDEAEVSVLGAILLDKNAIVEVAEFLHPDHFYDEKHQEIFEAMVSLYEDRAPIDVLTLSDKLTKRKSLKNVGGTAYLADLANRVPTAAHVKQYAKIVKDTATKRSLMNASARLVELSMDDGMSADELLDKAESHIFSLSQKHLVQGFAPVKATLADSFDRLDELHKLGSGMRGIPTGFKELDDLTAGLQKSNLIILAGRPGGGKTSFVTNIAQHLSVNLKRPTAIFSLEMSKEELVDRLLVAQADIDSWKLKTGKLNDDDFSKLSTAMGELAEAPLFIDDMPAQTILEMRTKARRLQAEHGVDLLIVDYLQLAQGKSKDNRVQEVAEISQGLKNLARELKIPVIALSQLNRSVESRDVKRPNLSDLRESGCLLGDTLITMSDTGERIKIEDLVGKKDFNVLAMNGDFKIKPAVVSKVFPSGEKVVYEMVLKSGKRIKASANHPFFTVSGWKRLDELKEEDRIATPRHMKIIQEQKYFVSLNENKTAVLAHLIGDGCFVKRQPLHYTNADMSLIQLVQEKALAEFDIKPRIVQQENWYHLYLAASQHLTHGKRNPIVKWLDEDMKIYGLRSREKFVPDAIFMSNNETISTFLKNIWATDGSITLTPDSKEKRKARIYYASGSFQLATDISSLLLRLGIISKLTNTKKIGYQDMWTVDIQGKENQLKFIKEIGIVGNKTLKVIAVQSFLEKIESNPNNDVIPKEIWEYIEELRRENGLTTREFHKQMGWAYSGTQRQGNGIGRDRLKKIAKLLKDFRLNALADSDLYWDEIKEIKKIGKKKVYDMSVPGINNFIANDIIVHNSIEQDADIVMFLWPEDDEDRSQIVLDIAKHRNGALGQIKLFFKGDRTKFYPREIHHGPDSAKN